MQISKLSVGIDLGGTNVRAGLVSQGEVVRASSARIAHLQTEQEVLDVIFEQIESVGLAGVARIGIGVPSIVDVRNGIVYDTVNIPSWKEVHLKAILEARYNVPVSVNNDANCFALGEQRYGAGAGCSNLVGLTIGTGLGAGIITDNRLFNGTNCGAGEIGNIPYKEGILENYASGQFFTNTYRCSGEEFLKLAENGDQEALAVFREFGRHFGHALLIAVYAFDPQVIVLGGSVSRSFPYFEESAMEVLKTCVFPHTLKSLRVAVSSLKEVAIVGASCLGTANS